MKNFINQGIIVALVAILLVAVLPTVSNADGYGVYGPYGPHIPAETGFVSNDIVSIIGLTMYGLGTFFVVYGSKLKSMFI